MVRPFVIFTLTIVICDPPPVKRPRALTTAQSAGMVTVIEDDWPPGDPSPQVPTASAVTIADGPAGAGVDPENESAGSTSGPEATTTPLTRTSTSVFWPMASPVKDPTVKLITAVLPTHTALAVIVGCASAGLTATICKATKSTPIHDFN